MASDNRIRIGISGSYGGMNLGDEAILEGILGQIRATLNADITVFSRNPEDTLARHRVERAVPVRSLTRKESIREIQQLDLFVLGGGGILFDDDVQGYLRDVFIAEELGVPVMTYAISAGPLTTTAAREAVQTALNAASLVTVRDRIGLRLLEDVGVTRDIHLTADPALLLEPEELAIEALHAEGVEFDRDLVGFSVREPGPAAPHIDPDDYYALLANAADFVVERYDAEVVFVPMELTDVQHSHAVVAHMQNSERAEILRRRYTPRQVLDLIGRFQFSIGMRLHFLIFSALRGVPFAALPYAGKVSGLLQDLGLKSPPLGDVGIGQLIARVDRSWDTRHEIHAQIADHISELRQRARRTNELLLELLEHTGVELPASAHWTDQPARHV
jgi:polysaccharide pyruvyl transferase CsaB